MKSSTIQAEALAYMQELVTKYGEGTCWVTKNKAINLRTMWDIVRENYFGIFTKTKDRFNQDKIFYPLTETMVWENVKNIDIDTKDINTRALHPDGLSHTIPARYILKDWMYLSNFGETINKWLMYFVLDGHLFTKTITGTDEAGKKYVKTVFVDPRNCFYDPHAEDIHQTPFIERSVQNLDDIKENFKNKSWINLNKLEGRTNIPRLKDEQKEHDVGVPEVEIYEYWGKIKKSWVTGNNEDKDIWVEGTMWASNLMDNALVHKIQLNNKLSPYEDVAFEDAPNRHPGRGVGEKVLFLQIYLNTLYNVRRMNNLVLQNQLFKFKNGTGITADSISSLVAGGAIGVNEMEDFDRIDTRNLNFNESLNEETNLIGIANRITSNQEPASGQAMPASTPATNAIIQNQAVKSSQQLRQERFGLFLTRLFRRQLFPRLVELYKSGDIIRLDKDEKIGRVRKNIANYYALQGIQQSQAMGMPANPVEMQGTMEKSLSEREDIFMQIDKIDPKLIDIEFYVTDESFDKNTILQNLQQILWNYNQFASDPRSQNVLREIYDILGVDSDNLLPETTQAPMMAGLPQQSMQPQQPQSNTAVPGQIMGNQFKTAMAQTARV